MKAADERAAEEQAIKSGVGLDIVMFVSAPGSAAFACGLVFR
jgi:hypothetical protein